MANIQNNSNWDWPASTAAGHDATHLRITNLAGTEVYALSALDNDTAALTIGQFYRIPSSSFSYTLAAAAPYTDKGAERMLVGLFVGSMKAQLGTLVSGSFVELSGNGYSSLTIVASGMNSSSA